MMKLITHLNQLKVNDYILWEKIKEKILWFGKITRVEEATVRMEYTCIEGSPKGINSKNARFPKIERHNAEWNLFKLNKKDVIKYEDLLLIGDL